MIDINNLVHTSWNGVLNDSFNGLESEYIDFLNSNKNYFPDKYNFLNAFKTLSLHDTKYILFGQDPYPRYESAIGYAFIDGRVKSIFSKTGFSKEVNRATSLRNFIKMLLLCEGKLTDDFSQSAIASIDKEGYIDSIDSLRKNFEKNGVLLLNTALVFTSKEESKKHIKSWKNFTERLLYGLQNQNITLILFGKAAADLEKFSVTRSYKKVILPHPYNISFIENPKVYELFKSMNLLRS